MTFECLLRHHLEANAAASTYRPVSYAALVSRLSIFDHHSFSSTSIVVTRGPLGHRGAGCELRCPPSCRSRSARSARSRSCCVVNCFEKSLSADSRRATSASLRSRAWCRRSRSLSVRVVIAAQPPWLVVEPDAAVETLSVTPGGPSIPQNRATYRH